MTDMDYTLHFSIVRRIEEIPCKTATLLFADLNEEVGSKGKRPGD